MKPMRKYQSDAVTAIDEADDSCIIKMFCGSGKTCVMIDHFLKTNNDYGVFVFPSIALITQFNKDYGGCFSEFHIINICSKDDNKIGNFTTDSADIKYKIENNSKKVVFVTYQSLHTFSNASDFRPNNTYFDEAHHVVESVVIDVVSNGDFGKKVFLTATPPNKLRDLCDIVYDYSHKQGVSDDILNDFQIYIDLSFDTDDDIYAKLSRAILKTGNSRVMSFHSDVVNSIKTFVDELKFKEVFNKVCSKEFPSLISKYSSIRLIAIDGGTKGEDRVKLLEQFDEASDTEIFILASCRTIGEGIDTKKANMCVFVDSKQSIVQIIQNIGRIVRKQENISTVFIPSSVNKEKYSSVTTDEERDLIIRQGLCENGDFRMILNVLSALREDDPETFELCMQYPNSFSPDEMASNFEKQGVKLDTKVQNEEEFKLFVENNPSKKIEVHTHDMEEPVIIINKDGKGDLKFYKDEEDVYHQMKTKKKVVSPPKRKSLTKFHYSDDFKVLWNISDESLYSEHLCGMIEAKITGYDREKYALESAQAIIDFKKQHNKFPSKNSKDEYEKKLGYKFERFKTSKKGKGTSKLYQIVDDLFTKEFGADWFEKDLEAAALEQAQAIVAFTKQYNKFPSPTSKDDYEKKLGYKFMNFKTSKKGKGHRGPNYKKVDDLFTKEIGADWFENEDLEALALEQAEAIVAFVKQHNKFPSESAKDADEKKLGLKFGKFKQAKKGKGTSNFYQNFDELLTKEFGTEWAEPKDLEALALEQAKVIVIFTKQHNKFPSSIAKDDYEKKLGKRFGSFKQTKKGKGNRTKAYKSVDELFTKEFGDDWFEKKVFTKPTCTHKWKEVDTDDVYSYQVCEKCGRHTKKNRNSKDGRYHEPNPEKKKDINEWLKSIEYIKGKAIVLDADEMNTTKSLNETQRFDVNSIIVPEYDTETFENNSKHEAFGKCMVNGMFLDELKRVDINDVSLIYADFTGHFDKYVRPLLDYLEKVKVRKGTIMGITWSINGDRNNAENNREKLTEFRLINMWEKRDDGPCESGYGKGGNMYVQFFEKK